MEEARREEMITVINCGDDCWEALHDVNEIIARIEADNI